ncbi:MAG: right-handed parallel beta-helix repeat-containing protein, partial [Candidatus Nanopelagicales bacterium]|nr:right-handed parallel beta-helix repeat-containing protein [Candidatus Nanopelagicales bacterium]
NPNLISHAFIQFSPGRFWISTEGGAGTAPANVGISAAKSWGVTLLGAGRNLTLLMGVTLVDSGSDRLIVELGWFSTVRDMSVQDHTLPTNVLVNGINPGDYNTIDNVYGYGTGHLVVSDSTEFDVKIVNCTSEYTRGLLRMTGTEFSFKIDSCQVGASGSGDYAAIDVGSTAFDIRVSNTTVSTAGTDGFRSTGSDNLALVGCRFRTLTGVGVAVSGTVLQTVIVGCEFSAATSGIGIYVREPPSISAVMGHVSILGCTFVAALDYGIRIDPSDSTIEHAAIVANNFNSVDNPIFIDGSTFAAFNSKLVIADNVFGFPSASTGTAVIYVVGSAGRLARMVSIDGNMIEGHTFDAIYCALVEDLTVQGNTVVAKAVTAGEAISVVECDAFLVADNRVRYDVDPSATTDAILIDGTYTTGTVQGNRVIPPAGGGTNLRYGINPASASGSGLLVVTNDYRGTWGTAGLNTTNTPIVAWSGGADGENRA